MNILKKYIATEPEVDVVLKGDKDDATLAVAGVIHKDTELGEAQDLDCYHQKEGVREFKLGEDLPEEQRHMLKNSLRR